MGKAVSGMFGLIALLFGRCQALFLSGEDALLGPIPSRKPAGAGAPTGIGAALQKQRALIRDDTRDKDFWASAYGGKTPHSYKFEKGLGYSYPGGRPRPPYEFE